jgi:WhiB family redox-sensing transcriptional regulator
MGPLDWMEQALCASTDPALFFPEDSAAFSRHAKARAKAICGRCAVQAECLAYAMAEPWISDGVWAGFDAGEIRRMTQGAA